MRFLGLASALLCCCIAAAPAADDLDDAAAPDVPAPDPAAPAAPAPPVAKPAAEKRTNTKALAAVRAFAAKRTLALAETATPPVRIIQVGTAPLAANRLAVLGAQTLRGLEQWSGQNRVFLPAPLPPEEEIVLVVFTADRDYEAWAEAHAGGEKSMAKQTAGFPGPRTLFARGSAVAKMAEPWAVYSTTVVAIDAFYADRGGRAPSWIREGCAAEMQRLQCGGKILCASIAYEKNDQKRLSEGWGKEVARMVQQRDPALMRTLEILRTDVTAVPPATYYQQWSLNCWLRQVAGQQTGPENRWYRLLLATAGGTDSGQAVREVLKLDDPAMTRAWLAWAATAGK